MAKTLVQGSFQNASYNTLYTAPSTKYAKVTFMYCGLSYFDSNTTSSNYVNQINVNEVLVVKGNFPFTGQVPMAGTSPNNSTIQGLTDSTLLIPPSGVLQYRNWGSQNTTAYYAFIVEEIASSTVLA